MEDLSCLTPNKDYSDAVTQKKREALEEGALTKIFRHCFKRGEQFEKIGEAVDINEVVAGIAPNSTPVLQNGKFFFNGLHNYTDERGQLYGRSRSDFNMATCFHIKKRGEM